MFKGVKIITLIECVYPPVCGFCGKLHKGYLCKKCEIKLNKDECMKIVRDEENDFQEQMYFFRYEGFVRQAILRYKFRDKAYLYKSFVKFMIKKENFMKFLQTYDIIIPVPISKERKRERGYNQSLLISKEIGNLYNKKIKMNILKVNSSCLIKVKNTVEQSKLNKEQRDINVKGVYKLRNDRILTNKRVLLVDDIYTTGNTVRECCHMIKKANPDKIGVLTITKGFVDKGKG